MRAFLYQWRQDFWLRDVRRYTGRPLPYSASEQFRSVGVLPGDAIYVAGFGPAREYLVVIGRFIAAAKREVLPDGDPRDACLTEEEAKSVLGDNVYGLPLFRAPWYLIPRPGSASLMRFDRRVPLTPPLLFGKPSEIPRQLYVDPDGKVNMQAIRSMSRMRNSTAAALDRVLSAGSEATEPPRTRSDQWHPTSEGSLPPRG